MDCPLSMPAGIFTWSVEVLARIPSPPQCLHFFVGCCPRPWQVGHVVTVCMVPKNVRWFCTTCPCPLHVAHVSSLLPGSAPVPPHTSHFDCLRREISFSTPNAASLNSISTST